jgi:hypothetical protein
MAIFDNETLDKLKKQALMNMSTAQQTQPENTATSSPNVNEPLHPDFMQNVKTILGNNPSIAQFLLGAGSAMAGNAQGNSFAGALGKGIEGGGHAAMQTIANENTKKQQIQQALLQQALTEKLDAVKADRSEKHDINKLDIEHQNKLIEDAAKAENKGQKYVNGGADKFGNPLALGTSDGQFRKATIIGSDQNLTSESTSSQQPVEASPTGWSNGTQSTGLDQQPGESMIAYKARLDLQEAQRQEQVRAEQAAATAERNQKLSFSQEQMKQEAPLVNKYAADMESHLQAADNLHKMANLAKESNTGTISGSVVGQWVRGALGDEDFQQLMAMQKDTGVKFFGGKLGSGVSTVDLETVLDSIYNPKNESKVNVRVLNNLRHGLLRTVSQNRNAINDYQKHYGVEVGGYNDNSVGQYLDYPKQVKMGGQVHNVDGYDPTTKSYLINGEWLR